MNTLLNAMKENNNIKRTENNDIAYRSTMNGLMDLFALGGAYRSRSDEDCILLFQKAFDEDETLALKCLFYLRDVRGGQGQRRFFRVVTRWLAINRTEAMSRNLMLVPEFGRWDDLYTFIGTPLERQAFDVMKVQLALDVECKTPSLLAKWLKSENTSSAESRRLGAITRKYFGMTPRQYRKTLSILRGRIRIVERLMSENRWNEIEFDKLPSRAGFIYRNAFARHDLIREKYEKFAKDTTTKVNAKTLNPCDVVHQAIRYCDYNRWSNQNNLEDTERVMINKYWDNLENYFHNAIFNGVAVVDTSGSMTCYGNKMAPIDVAVALGMYCAEKCNPNSPWYGNYITFSRHARLVPVEGVDFVDKVYRIVQTNLCENTNIESVFNLILNLAVQNRVPQEEMPENIVIISDMEFDEAQGKGWDYRNVPKIESVMEKCMGRYQTAGYQLPKLVFWNCSARNDTIPMRDNGNVTFVSGYSAVTFEMIMSGKTGLQLVLDKLNSDRYSAVK